MLAVKKPMVARWCAEEEGVLVTTEAAPKDWIQGHDTFSAGFGQWLASGQARQAKRQHSRGVDAVSKPGHQSPGGAGKHLKIINFHQSH
jgi:hypothetical protein